MRRGLRWQGRIKKAELIMCLAPLPEGLANPVLTRMLAPAPYQMPEKEDEVGGKRTKDGLYSQGTSDFVSGGIKIPSSEDKSEGGATISFPPRKKRAASEDWEKQATKRGKMPLGGGPGLEDVKA